MFITWEVCNKEGEAIEIVMIVRENNVSNGVCPVTLTVSPDEAKDLAMQIIQNL